MPFPDGWEPDDDHDRGGADDAFASVVFDEDFIRSARIHEPTAVERLLSAAEARAEAEHRTRPPGTGTGDESGHEPEPYDDSYDPYDPDDEPDSYARRTHTRWHRPVAWLLALVMGIGMVALAFTAVYRGASSGRQDRVPAPATTGVDQGRPATPDYSAPAVSAQPHTP